VRGSEEVGRLGERLGCWSRLRGGGVKSMLGYRINSF
jgi:hypothetical protein